MGKLVTKKELMNIDFAGQIAALASGCFDLLHINHVRALRQHRALGDVLVVCVLSDAQTRRQKGPSRPITPEAERAELVAALECVDYAYIEDGERSADHQLLRHFEHLIYVVTADPDQAPRYAELRTKLLGVNPGVQLEFVPQLAGVSTSDIIVRLPHD